MAIDTRNKRAACLLLLGVGGRVFPTPDGSLASAADRQHMGGAYVLAAESPPAAAFSVEQLAPQHAFVDLRTDVRANLASQHLARLDDLLRCTYTEALDHAGTCTLEVRPEASYVADLRVGRVLRITHVTGVVLEYRIDQVHHRLEEGVVRATARHVIHDLNRYFLWESLGGVPALALAGTDLSPEEWIVTRVIPVLTAAGVTYVQFGSAESARLRTLEWQGQTVLWLLNQLIEGTDLDLDYRILNPGAAVERYGISLVHVGETAPRPRVLVGENATALEWNEDGDLLANVMLPQGATPAGGLERSNIGEYVARVTAVAGAALTLEDPDGNPNPVYADGQLTDLYLELLVPPLMSGPPA